MATLTAPLYLVEPAPHSAAADARDGDVLLQWMRGPSQDAVASLVRRDGKRVFSYCFRMLHNDADAMDTMQKVFVQADRDFGQFVSQARQRPNCCMREWLLGIAHHRCMDATRRRRRDEVRIVELAAHVDAVPDRAGLPDERLDQERIRRALEDCLGGLPPDVLSSVLMKYREGLNYEAMGEQTGAKPSTLQKRVSRALPQLLDCLERKGFRP